MSIFPFLLKNCANFTGFKPKNQRINENLRDFLDYEKTKREEEAEEDDTSSLLVPNGTQLLRPADLETFIQWPEYEFWRGFIRLSEQNGTTHLDRFFLTTAYKGEELKDWVERDVALKRWRKVVDKYR